MTTPEREDLLTGGPANDGPTLFQVMRRPRWILALLLALAVAGGFAWLGKWQLENAVLHDNSHLEQSETVRPLSDLNDPGTPVSDLAAGMIVSLEGQLLLQDFLVVEERLNQGEMGVWVTGHVLVSQADGSTGNLAVAYGWAPDVETARSAISNLESLQTSEGIGSVEGLEGRFMPPEGERVPKPDEDPNRILSMIPAQLINLWEDFDGAPYAGYLVVHPGQSTGVFSTAELESLGLSPIDSVPPEAAESISWLNLFYALEWVVFAGFAVFLWYRVARDAWEKELQRLEEEPDSTEQP